MTTGLLDLVQSEGQLVGALAHETGHIMGQHLTRIDGQARTLRGVFFVGGPAGFALWRSIGQFVVLKLVRNKEFEADRLGLRYEIASKYEPLEFCRFLQLAFRKEEQSEPFFDRVHETHPSTNVRVRRLRASSSDLRAHHTVHVINRSEFSEMKKHFGTFIDPREISDVDEPNPQSAVRPVAAEQELLDKT
jgi:predicted Zn-dependent protease